MVTTNIEFQRRCAALVEREVLVCMSSVVSALASGYGDIMQDHTGANRPLRDLTDQAMELACPVPDYEEAAHDAGWRHLPREPEGQNVYRDETDGQTWCAADWEALCRDHDIEPYDRDVFEHWAVSSWLAEKLEAKGEKVDRDFAGLNVWARTTTGQAISIDAVIEAITKETGYASFEASPPAPETTEQTAPPWDDMKVAFGFDGNVDELWDAAHKTNTLRLPQGWSLDETDGAGARMVAVFRVAAMPTAADGEAVLRELARY